VVVPERSLDEPHDLLEQLMDLQDGSDLLADLCQEAKTCVLNLTHGLFQGCLDGPGAAVWTSSLYTGRGPDSIGPAPTGSFTAASAELAGEKPEFGASRRAKWFGPQTV
jgi:hypothetical protein